MRFVFIIAAFLIFGMSGVASARAGGGAQFFESIQDLPLMPGLVERADATVVFDKPEGRIIESVAEMRGVSDAQVRVYYAGSLPQFGWQPAGPDVFVRDGERLELAFEPGTGSTLLRVMVSPR